MHLTICFGPWNLFGIILLDQIQLGNYDAMALTGARVTTPVELSNLIKLKALVPAASDATV